MYYKIDKYVLHRCLIYIHNNINNPLLGHKQLKHRLLIL